MALSGTVTTNKYSDRYYKLTWTATQSIEDNTSTIDYTLSAEGEGWWAERTLKVDIGGTKVIEKTNNVQRWDGVIKTGSVTLDHDTYGNKSFSISIEAAVYYSTVNVTGSGSFTLDTIPRAATITSAPDFHDEENPTIYYSNPAGDAVDGIQVGIYQDVDGGGSSLAAYRSVDLSKDNYTIELTDDERAKLRRYVTSGKSVKVRFYLRTNIGGTNYHNNVTKTFRLINADPIAKPVVEDINEASIRLTGNPGTIIRKFNKVRFNTGAVGTKEATIASQRVTCGNFSSNNATGTFTGVIDKTFRFKITDSRGTTLEMGTVVNFVSYLDLTCHLEASIELDTDTTSKITFSGGGNYWVGNFGAVNNQIQCKYRIKPDDGEYGDWVSINPNVPLGAQKYTFEGTIDNLDYQKSYTLQVMAADEIYTEGILSNEVQLTTIPVFDWSNEDFNFNVPVSIQGEPIADFVIEEEDNGSYAFRKWASGKLEAWRSAGSTVSVSASAGYGSLYYHDNLSVSTTGRASQFTEIDSVQMTFNKGGASGLWYPVIKNWSISGGQATVTYMAINPTNLSANIIPCVYIIGKWR